VSGKKVLKHFLIYLFIILVSNYHGGADQVFFFLLLFARKVLLE